jgi:hypothetical protein
VTLSPRLVADWREGVHVLELRDEPPRRALYALTPRTGTTAGARELLDAVRAIL